jgi:hypothetical protein
MYLIKVLAVLAVRTIAAAGSQFGPEIRVKKEDDVHIQFRYLGATYDTMGYAHLLIPVDTSETVAALRELKKAMDETMKNKYRWYQIQKGNPEAHDEQWEQMTMIDERIIDLLDKVTFLDGIHENRREKRFIFAFAIAATLFGLFTIAGLTALTVNQVSLSNEQHHIASELAATESRVSGASREIIQLNDAIKNVTEVVNRQGHQLKLLATMDRFMMTVQKISDGTSKFEAIINKATSGRLAVEAINMALMQDVLGRLKKEAEEKGFDLLVNSAWDLLQVDTSFVGTDNGFMLYVHIPLVKYSQPYQILRYVPFPYPVDKDNDTSLVMWVQPEEEVIAVNEKQQLFRSMTHADLIQCRKMGVVHICDHSGVAHHTKVKDSCIHNLYGRDWQGIKDTCNLRLKTRSDVVQDLGNNTFMVFNKEPTPAQLSCPGNPHTTPGLLSGTVSVTVPPGCQLLTNSHVMTGADIIETVTKTTYVFKWPFDPKELFGELDLTNINADDIKPGDVIDKKKIDEWLDRERRYNEQTFGDRFHLTTMAIGSICGFISLALMILMIGGSSWYSYRNQQTWLNHKMSIPPQ